MLSPSLILFAVDSNDSLYGGDRKFVAEVSKLVHTLLEQALEHMKTLATSDEVVLRHTGPGGVVNSNNNNSIYLRNTFSKF